MEKIENLPKGKALAKINKTIWDKTKVVAVIVSPEWMEELSDDLAAILKDDGHKNLLVTADVTRLKSRTLDELYLWKPGVIALTDEMRRQLVDNVSHYTAFGRTIYIVN